MMLGKIESRRRRAQQRKRWLYGITDSMDLSLSKLWELVMDRRSLACCSPWGHKESVRHIRWPKYWSFSLSISPSNEYSRLISFRIDWFDLLQSKGLSIVFSDTAVQKHQFFSFLLVASQCPTISGSLHCTLPHSWICYLDLHEMHLW